MTAVAVGSRRPVHVAVHRCAALAVGTGDEPVALAGGEGIEQALALADQAPRAIALQARERFGMAFRGQQLFTAIGAVAGRPGPPGPPGPDGGSAVQCAAATELSALRVVYELDGQVSLLDYRDADHVDLVLGITLTAASAGAPINVQRSGWLDDAGWSWVPGRVWLGSNGALTQAVPADGFDLLIGVATSATRITLDIQEPIQLEA